jgi:hypothetical protein
MHSFSCVKNWVKFSTVKSNDCILMKRGNVGGRRRWFIVGSKPITTGYAIRVLIFKIKSDH